MLFSKEEVKRARALREAGLHWKVQMGHWYVTADGFVSMVNGKGEAEECKAMYVWLPLWSDCRIFLKEHGYGHPEVLEDENDRVVLELHSESSENLRVSGLNDRSCLYMAMMRVFESRG